MTILIAIRLLLGLCLLATLPRKLFSCGWLQKPPRAMPIDPLRSHLKITAHSSGLHLVSNPHTFECTYYCWPKTIGPVLEMQYLL